VVTAWSVLAPDWADLSAAGCVPPRGMTGRASEKIRVAEVVTVSEAPQAAEILGAELALRCLYRGEPRIRRLLVVRVLWLVPAFVSVHNAGQSGLIGRPGREEADPAGLGRIPFPHAASMKAAFPVALAVAS
jgi:hypothetical protein